MSTSTNPFAAALEAQRTGPDEHAHQQQQQYTPHNPFATEQPVPASPPPSTNPFRATSPPRTHQSALPYSSTSVGQSPDPPVSAAGNNQDSADLITQSLSGLDFGAGATSSVPRAASVQQQQQHIVEPSREASVQPVPQLEPAPLQPNFAEPSTQPMTTAYAPPAASSTMYAPPPGPPPGHPDAQLGGYQLGAPNDDQAALDQVRRMEADEAYARKVYEREQGRVQRRSQQSSQQQLGAQDEGAPGLARSQQKRRQESYDPVLAAVGGAPAPRALDSPAPALQPRAAMPPVRTDANEEKQWNTKEIYWQGRSQRVIVQNENGPCSLISLSNVLLLRGTVQITPEDRPAVSYGYLSSMLGEHLLDVISSQPDGALDLEAALSILPQTQYGLDVNVKFAAIDGFAVEEAETDAPAPTEALGGSSSAGGAAATTAHTNKGDKATQRGELALFKLCGVPLVHGWLAEPSDSETWAAVVERAGNYDKALDRVVAGDDLTKGMVVEGPGGQLNEAVLDGLSPEDKQVVNDALLIRRFLEATATQLTYPGLYALSTTLERGALYALFRNSHLSVLYRPTEQDLSQHADTAAAGIGAHDQPQLYQLVTDSTLENEDGIVWESVEDVDGSASRFYDGKFRPAHVQQDFVGQRRNGPQDDGQVDEDADFAYAQQLQDQEQRRAERHRRQVDSRRMRPQQQQQQQQQSASGGSGNMIARMLANRKAGKRAPTTNVLEQNVSGSMGGRPAEETYEQQYVNGLNGAQSSVGQNGFGAAEELPQQQRDKKWWKKVF